MIDHFSSFMQQSKAFINKINENRNKIDKNKKNIMLLKFKVFLISRILVTLAFLKYSSNYNNFKDDIIYTITIHSGNMKYIRKE